MKITLSIDSKETFAFNISDAINIVSCIDDEAKYASFFSLLAEHPSSEVCCVTANKSCVPLKVLKQLARDSSIEVVRTVASNESALKKFKLSLLQEMIARDVSVAMAIADSLYFMGEELHEDVIQALLQHDDPKVVETAENFVQVRELG
jgi:hypothetical protein